MQLYTPTFGSPCIIKIRTQLISNNKHISKVVDLNLFSVKLHHLKSTIQVCLQMGYFGKVGVKNIITTGPSGESQVQILSAIVPEVVVRLVYSQVSSRKYFLGLSKLDQSPGQVLSTNNLFNGLFQRCQNSIKVEKSELVQPLA